MSSKQQIAVGVDVTASGTHITLMAPTDTSHMEVIYSEFHPMPPAQRQHAQGAPWAFEPAAPEFPTRSGRVYTCIDCSESRPTARWRRLPSGRVEMV